MKKPGHLRLEMQDTHSWAFNRPREWEFFDYKLDRAEVAGHEGDKDKATQICLELINSCPEYLPALNKLGLLFREAGNLDRAILIFQSAVGIGLACLPDEFELGTDLIPWHWEDNRAFLLACEYLGACYLEKSLDAFEDLLEINPGYRGIADLVGNLRKLCGLKDENVE
jgi:tetratricopeptide (TPR) repeat protein